MEVLRYGDNHIIKDTLIWAKKHGKRISFHYLGQGKMEVYMGGEFFCYCSAKYARKLMVELNLPD